MQYTRKALNTLIETSTALDSASQSAKNYITDAQLSKLSDREQALARERMLYEEIKKALELIGDPFNLLEGYAEALVVNLKRINAEFDKLPSHLDNLLSFTPRRCRRSRRKK